MAISIFMVRVGECSRRPHGSPFDVHSHGCVIPPCFSGGVCEPGLLQDLWRFHRHTRQWVWLLNPTSPTNVLPNYGVRRAASGASLGSRAYGCTVTDEAGGVLFFGG